MGEKFSPGEEEVLGKPTEPAEGKNKLGNFANQFFRKNLPLFLALAAATALPARAAEKGHVDQHHPKPATSERMSAVDTEQAIMLQEMIANEMFVKAACNEGDIGIMKDSFGPFMVQSKEREGNSAEYQRELQPEISRTRLETILLNSDFSFKNHREVDLNRLNQELTKRLDQTYAKNPQVLRAVKEYFNKFNSTFYAGGYDKGPSIPQINYAKDGKAVTVNLDAEFCTPLEMESAIAKVVASSGVDEIASKADLNTRSTLYKIVYYNSYNMVMEGLANKMSGSPVVHEMIKNGLVK